MKKIFLLQLIFTISYFTGSAQKIQLGFTSGPTISNYEARANNTDISSDPKIGFALGFITRIAIRKHFIFQPEINWVQKGTKDNQTTNRISERILLTTNHIEIPLNFMYAARNGFFAGGGPSFSFAVSGKLKEKVEDNEVSEKIHYGNGDDDIMKPFDFGGNILVGYRFKKGFLMSANYNLGFSNLSNGDNTGTATLTSYYFGIKIGYLFSFAKKK